VIAARLAATVASVERQPHRRWKRRLRASSRSSSTHAPFKNSCSWRRSVPGFVALRSVGTTLQPLSFADVAAPRVLRRRAMRCWPCVVRLRFKQAAPPERRCSSGQHLAVNDEISLVPVNILSSRPAVSCQHRFSTLRFRPLLLGKAGAQSSGRGCQMRSRSAPPRELISNRRHWRRSSCGLARSRDQAKGSSPASSP